MRADASVAIGTGHVMRTLTLAEALRARRLDVAFACRRFPGDAVDRIVARGFPVLELGGAEAAPGTWLGASLPDEIAAVREAVRRFNRAPSWFVVDHYELDARWERAVAEGEARVFVIDDLADRPHACAALLDQNAQAAGRYDGLVPPDAIRFLGPRYALVREEFAAARASARPRERVDRILVFYGGIDAHGETAKALRALRGVAGEFAIEAIVADASPARGAAYAEAARDPRVTVVRYADDMAVRMAAADLALGAAGTASWERCFVGLPAVATAIAQNQEAVLAALERAGAVVSLGPSRAASEEAMRAAVTALAADPARLRRLGERAFALCDGHEAAREEVLDAILDRLS